MRIGSLIVALAAGVSGLAAITPVAAFAPGRGALAVTYHGSAAAVNEVAPLVAVKWKRIVKSGRPAGAGAGRPAGAGGAYRPAS